jgi:transcriptional regulator with XRE-family HTH domain
MQEEEIHALIEALQRYQRERYCSLRGLGRRLGISPAHLSMIFAGKRRPGIRFMRAVLLRFPELRHLIARALPPAKEDKR